MARENPETRIAIGRAGVFAPRVAPIAHPLSFGGAARPATLPQRIVGFSVLGLLIGGLVVAATPTLHVLHGLFFTAFAVTAGLRLAAAFVPRKRLDTPWLRDEDLPVYTVIAPLYREAAVAPELIAALERIDYPRERLQVLVMLEADDLETRRALAAIELPSFVQVVVAPPAEPKTNAPRLQRRPRPRPGRAGGHLRRRGPAGPDAAARSRRTVRRRSGPPRLPASAAPHRP